MVRHLDRAIELLAPGSRRLLNYVHVGKCGGTTVRASIRDSPVVASEFSYVFTTHVRRPRYRRRTRYLFVVRNPIDRAESAFAWRKKIVVAEGRQADRFPGEASTLMRYESLSQLAEELYDNEGWLNEQAAASLRSVHHIREDLAFYLDPLVWRLDESQVFAVLRQDRLGDDIAKSLGCEVVPVKNRNTLHKHEMTPVARGNLGRFLHRDFECLEQLALVAGLSDDSVERLLAR